MKRILIVFGTRPEAIKMAPLVLKLKSEKSVQLTVCVTGQHSDLLNPVLDFFSIVPDINLNIIESKPLLHSVYALILEKMHKVIADVKPDLILVHGDTATTAAVSMSAFLNKIELGHVEAGLRTGDINSPWPEEFNRRLVSLVANYHFAPTQTAMDNLLAEGVDRRRILVTGNTVIDALYTALNMLVNDEKFLKTFFKKYPYILNGKKSILVTMHRRENFGQGVEDFCETLKDVAKQNPDAQIIFPVHLNPNIRLPAHQILSNVDNIFLIDPMEYREFIFMMQKSYLMITDSGGVQEEAPSLGKPVLVTRTTTERPEAVAANTVRLVGTDKDLILQWVGKLFDEPAEYLAMSEVTNPYGDGLASDRIVKWITDQEQYESIDSLQMAYDYVQGQRRHSEPSFDQVKVN